MTKGLRKRVESVIEEKVRPQLAEHSGDIEIVDLKDGVLKVRFLGMCSNCPSAYMTLESTVCGALKEEVPEIEDVILITGVSDDLLDLANAMLKHKDNIRDYKEPEDENRS